MSETIILSGGPRSGEVMEYLGGEYLEFSIFKPMEAAYRLSEPPDKPIKYETALYVRSRRSPHIFVFQP